MRIALLFSLVLAPSHVCAQATWGAIEGRVVWGKKELPERRDLDAAIKLNPDKMFCLKDGAVFAEDWVVDPKTKGIRWVFVWLTPMDPARPLAIHPKLAKPEEDKVFIDQPVCMYIPHALGLRQGQTLVCKNTAKVNHNFKYITPEEEGNPLILPGKEFELKGLKASLRPTLVSCSIHPWMQAYVRVFDHPYFAVTAADGSFTIKDAPAGPCRMIIWHESGYRGGPGGKDGEVITVEADTTTKLKDKEFSPK